MTVGYRVEPDRNLHESDRATAEMFYQFAGQAYGSLGYEIKTAAELADRSASELLADV
ncbi:hypothetical protein B0I32_1508 [Nonomuraea fuscirosea]|uniref:Uncharacterized protein n=1 Tax=Nonomuraea fuscirosea TaxID=1291556 RepID=A0A2T0LNN0_9ACTN|nr:hypothetical protein [Nonomuraea fuscirosea]PRX44795.1 hypothetical protein B0I32_1508 [Nonomuraea fuscirosea]